MLTGAWADLADAAGGVVELAERLQVDRGTIRRWANGQRAINEITKVGIRTIAEQMGVKSPV